MMEPKKSGISCVCMSPLELKAFLLYKKNLVAAIDPLNVAYELKKNKCISQGLYEIIVGRFKADFSREDISEILLDNVPYHTKLLSFIKILDKCGYSHCSSKLFLGFVKIHTGFHEVQKSRNIDRRNVHSFFRKLKIMIHDAQLKNPPEFLRNLAKGFMTQFEGENDHLKRQRIADKIVAIIGAGIDAQAITFDTELPNNEMFSEMKSLVPYTENTLIADVVYYGRLANANAIAKKFENGEEMLCEARVRAYNTGPCLELVNMLYIQVYFLLWQYEQTPTEQIRDSLLTWGRIGIESLEEEEYGTKLMWRRMFILRMVFCLLGIGNRANIIHSARIDDKCANMAEELLADFDRYFHAIEQRRRMFYNVAKARLYQYRSEHELACLHASNAEKLAVSGNFKEIEFIRDFKLSLEQEENICATVHDDLLNLQIVGRIETNRTHDTETDIDSMHMHSTHADLPEITDDSDIFDSPNQMNSEETLLKIPVISESQTFVKR